MHNLFLLESVSTVSFSSLLVHGLDSAPVGLCALSANLICARQTFHKGSNKEGKTGHQLHHLYGEHNPRRAFVGNMCATRGIKDILSCARPNRRGVAGNMGIFGLQRGPHSQTGTVGNQNHQLCRLWENLACDSGGFS